jgi:outer membrane immunogenic protein
MNKLMAATALFTALSAPAMAADMRARPAPQPTYEQPAAVVDYAFNWTGAYVGANAGWRWLNADVSGGADGGLSLKDSSLFGGVQAGYNWQMNNFVFGLETDFGYGNARDSFTAVDTYSARIGAEGTTRARAGLAFDRFLVYGTAGVAYADVKGSYNGGSKDNWRVGWTAGGGLEYAVTKNVSIKGEYLYADYGSENVGATKQDITSNLVRVGLNYKF